MEVMAVMRNLKITSFEAFLALGRPPGAGGGNIQHHNNIQELSRKDYSRCVQLFHALTKGG